MNLWHRIFHHRHHHRHHHHRVLVLLLVNGYPILLIPNHEVNMTTVVTVGHKIDLAIIYLDQNGNPMLTPPAPDSVTWSNTNPAAETLASAGSTATATAIAPGADEIDLAVVVGGVTFSAALAVEVDPAPQVLTSVQIEPTVS